jgi:CRP-like cAMP-binding protein
MAVPGMAERQLPVDFVAVAASVASLRQVARLATSDVRVLELHKPAFEAILRERPETALAMMRILCDLLASSAAATE